MPDVIGKFETAKKQKLHLAIAVNSHTILAMKTQPQTTIPVIDLFAGPGGLGEGFSSYPKGEKNKRFEIRLSIEKESNAHKTLTLRAFFRQFPEGEIPEEYYEYVRGDEFFEERITWDDLKARFPDETTAALYEAKRLTLGKSETEKEIRKLIKERTKGADQWVLVGGPHAKSTL